MQVNYNYTCAISLLVLYTDCRCDALLVLYTDCRCDALLVLYTDCRCDDAGHSSAHNHCTNYYYLSLRDIAGHERFNHMTRVYYKYA